MKLGVKLCYKVESQGLRKEERHGFETHEGMNRRWV